MSKIFEGLDKATSRQIQNIVRQNPKGSADEKMLLKRYIMTPMVQDFDLSAEEWIGQATKWLAINQNNIKKNYPDVDTSDLIDLATKMYEDFLAMKGQLEEARWKGRIAGGLAGGPLGAILGDQLQKYIDDPEFRQKVDQAFGIDKLKGTNQPAQQVAEPEKKSGRTLSQTPDAIRKREQRAVKSTQATDKPATEKPRARVNPQTGALEPVKTDTPKTTKPKTTRTPKVAAPKSSLPSLDAEPGRTIGGGYQDARTWRNVGDKASDAAKAASKLPVVGDKLKALGLAAGVVGGVGSAMYAGIEDKFKDLLGKEDDKPKANTKPSTASKPDSKPAPDKVETPPPPQSSQPAVEPESDILGAPGADTAERTTPLDGPTGGRPPIGTSSEPDILGAPGADVSEPNSPIDRDRSRDRSTDAVIPQRPKKIEYDQPEMPFENTDAVAVPKPSSGALKKVAKTVGKGILPAATALTVGDDYKDLQKRLGNKDYTGAALRGVATTTGLLPHFGAQAVSAGAEGLLAMKDNPEYFKNYKPTSSIGRGIKEGYSAGAVGGTGLGEGDKPPKAGFNKNPHKVGPGTSKDDYEYKKFIPRDRKEKGEEWAIARDVRNVNSKLGKKKPKELNTGFYKNYLGNRPIREDQELSVQELATISDEALDKAYGYGRSTPGNTFGWQANLMSAAYAKKMIDAGITDIEKISDAIHKGWNITAQKFVQDPDQFSDTEKLRQAGKLEAKLQQRAKLMKINYAELPDDEQEKDRVVARALLKAITGDKLDEAGGRLGAINTVAQLFKSIAKGGDPVDMDIQQRQMNALMRKYNIDYKDIGVRKPTPQQSTTPPPNKPGAYKTWTDTLPSFDDPAKGGDYKKWEPNPIEEKINTPGGMGQAYRKLRLKPDEMDEGIAGAVKGGTKRIATMRKYFAGDETAKDPTDSSIQRAWFADPKNQSQLQPKVTKSQQTRTPVLTPEDKLDELSPKTINAFLDKASAAVRGGRPEPAKINPVTKQTAPPGWKVAAGKVAKPGTAMDHYAKVKAIEPKVPVKEYDANLISQIAAANKIKNPDLIYPGQKITLPSGDSYVVQKGDTLGDIVYNRTRPSVQEPVIAQPKVELPKEVPVVIPKAEPRISNKYPDSGVSSDSKFVDVRNNPGNLRGTDALRKPGYVLDKAVGFDKNGFAIFANPEDGKEAMRRQLALDALKRGLTGRQLINKYAPPSDNNDTDAYIKNTFGELGLDPDSKIRPEDLDKIQKLMVRQEHGKEGMNFYYPERQMLAQVNEMEILQRFLDKNIEKGAEKLAQKEKEKAAKERPIPNTNAEYQGPKSSAYDISLRKQSVDPVDVAMAALPKDIEDAKKLKQQSQAPKESSILKGIKGHKS